MVPPKTTPCTGIKSLPQPEFPELPKENEQSLLCGYYEDKGVKPVVGENPQPSPTTPLFQSQALSGSLLQRLNSIQLITFSHDERSNDAGEDRSWFELSIYRESDKTLNELRWMSHENRFKASQHQYHEGRIFTRHSEILKFLRGGDSIQVHASADTEKLTLHYKEGVLRFGVGCGDNDQSAEDPEHLKRLEADDAPSTFEILESTEPFEVEARIRDSKTKAVVVVSEWKSLKDIGKYESLAREAKHREKNVLLVFDAEALSESTKSYRSLSWGQTVENIWNYALEEPCKAIAKATPENEYFHFLVKIGFEGAIYKGFQAEATKAHLIYEPTSAKGSFIRSYSDTDMERFGIEGNDTQSRRDLLRAYLGDTWMDGLKYSLDRESADSIKTLGITQIRDALMIGIRWSRRMALPRDEGVQTHLDPIHHLKRESDSEPVLVSVELDLIAQGKDTQQMSFKKPLVLDSLPCTPQKAAHDTLTRGFESVLPYMPGARFGKLVTADRGEVDGFRKIANTVQEWYSSDGNPEPLYIAVFGQPGSGKSFGVKEVINSILKADSKSAKVDEFNLSQFGKIQDLYDAFGAIQDSDKGSQEVPVVFFDEFDTTFEGKELGWLAHFLGIINQGKYQDGGESKPVKRGIYVFIGGTHTTYDDFFKPVLGGTQASEAAIEASAFKKHLESSSFYKGSVPTVKIMDVDISTKSNHSDLITAFNNIKNEIKAESLPLVIFKNFDSYYEEETLGWLKYFLAPMQDGVFYDKGTKKELGRAIFVFEQGTHHFNGFPAKNLDYRDFPGAKLPDFVSRLRGCVGNKIELRSLDNVLTWYLEQNQPNKPLSIGSFRACETKLSERLIPLDTFRSKLKGYVNILGPSSLGGGDEKYFVIRRAMLLRSMLQRNFGFGEGQFIDMDPGVLNALLFTPRVLHGARSLESILSMSRIQEGVRIKKSDICTEDQRMLHVKGEAFQSLLDSSEVDPGTQATPENKRHYAWIERKSGRAYKPGTVVLAPPAAGSRAA
ncbi:hypothetical protein ASPFODRAFT_207183 [Aspergillus luchuensis CBS 106.47]|uniref:ATPase AAA-type core domain-containing protein n=1 Tax=Aspergillus luchuensis (strain CBS 106.47) TaxID=1137211 RepID=A0A1M3TJE5_ASPLC|nr:hypothetical protein ASPFODRAFT_207183 [Aspergillus luchuensis CBS 106.47]